MEAALIWKFVGVSLYLGVLIAIGVVASRRMVGLSDYFAGGKNLGFWAVAFSSRATGESAWLLLGLTGMGAVYGAYAFWVVLGEVLGVVGAWTLMSYRFKKLTTRYDSLTVPDYLESRFRDDTKTLRGVAAVALTVFVTIYVSAQIDATGKAFETFLPPSAILGFDPTTLSQPWLAGNFDYLVGALVGFAVVMAYSTSGGFVAVVWSDVFQGSLMFLGLVALPIVGVMTLGGPGELIAGLNAIDPDLLSLSGRGGWSLSKIASTIGLSLIGLGFLGSPQVFVRFLALRSEDEVPKGTLVAFLWTAIALSGAVIAGMVGRVALTRPGQTHEALFEGVTDAAGVKVAPILGSGGEAVLPMLVEHTMTPMVIGLYIAIVLSAIMSTVDSLLVVASSAVVRDGYQKVFNPELSDDDLLAMSRRATFGLALIALTLSMAVAYTSENRTVFWFVIFGWSGISATFCPTMILSLAWSGFTQRGALGAMVTGFLSVPLFKFVPPLFADGTGLIATGASLLVDLAELPPAFALSFAAGVALSLFDPAGQERVAGVADELAEAAA